MAGIVYIQQYDMREHGWMRFIIYSFIPGTAIVCSRELVSCGNERGNSMPWLRGYPRPM